MRTVLKSDGPRRETLAEAGMKFVRYTGPRRAVFQDIETGKEATWYANKGHASAGIRFNNTDWEFGVTHA